jgi:hypothetical protein
VPGNITANKTRAAIQKVNSKYFLYKILKVCRFEYKILNAVKL